MPRYIELKSNEAADELAKKGARRPLNGLKSFCGIGNEFVATTLKNKQEWLGGLYWASLPGMKQSPEELQLGSIITTIFPIIVS